MHEERYAISLRVIHPSIDPAEIGRAFGLTSEFAHHAGRPRMTPRGNPLKGLWRESFWVSPMDKGDSADRSLTEAIRGCLDRLAHARPFLHRIRAEGGRAEFFIGWFLSGNTGELMDCELLGRLGELKIDLSFDIYPPDVLRALDG